MVEIKKKLFQPSFLTFFLSVFFLYVNQENELKIRPIIQIIKVIIFHIFIVLNYNVPKPNLLNILIVNRKGANFYLFLKKILTHKRPPKFICWVLFDYLGTECNSALAG